MSMNQQLCKILNHRVLKNLENSQYFKKVDLIYITMIMCTLNCAYNVNKNMSLIQYFI